LRRHATNTSAASNTSGTQRRPSPLAYCVSVAGTISAPSMSAANVAVPGISRAIAATVSTMPTITRIQPGNSRIAAAWSTNGSHVKNLGTPVRRKIAASTTLRDQTTKSLTAPFFLAMGHGSPGCRLSRARASFTRCRQTNAITTAAVSSGVNTISAPAQNMLSDNASS
jgi:hypothetical protein